MARHAHWLHLVERNVSVAWEALGHWKRVPGSCGVGFGLSRGLCETGEKKSLMLLFCGFIVPERGGRDGGVRVIRLGVWERSKDCAISSGATRENTCAPLKKIRDLFWKALRDSITRPRRGWLLRRLPDQKSPALRRFQDRTFDLGKSGAQVPLPQLLVVDFVLSKPWKYPTAA